MTNELQNLEAQGSTASAEPASNRRTITPRSDIFETEQDIVVVADLPGVDEKSVDVTVEKNILTVLGTVHFEKPAKHNLLYAEYPIGNFERKFALPNEIEREAIHAHMKDGVLTLRLPKSAHAKVKKITVSAV